MPLAEKINTNQGKNYRGVGPPVGNRDPHCKHWTKSVGRRVSNPLGLAPVRTVKYQQHNYTISVSSFRVENVKQKDMMSEMPPVSCFHKSNPVCIHFIVLVLVPAFRQRDM